MQLAVNVETLVLNDEFLGSDVNLFRPLDQEEQVIKDNFWGKLVNFTVRVFAGKDIGGNVRDILSTQMKSLKSFNLYTTLRSNDHIIKMLMCFLQLNSSVVAVKCRLDTSAVCIDLGDELDDTSNNNFTEEHRLKVPQLTYLKIECGEIGLNNEGSSLLRSFFDAQKI